MGNTYSQSAQSFLDTNPDFGEYVQAEWRSQRAAELDALGGEWCSKDKVWISQVKAVIAIEVACVC